jgi:hypothetical protein
MQLLNQMGLTEYFHCPEETENSYVILTGTSYPNKSQGIGDDTNYIWHGCKLL